LAPDRKPRGYWDRPVATVVAALVLVALALVFVWELASLDARRRIEAERAADQYTVGVQERIVATCAERDPAAYVECVYEEVAASHENQRAEYDLDAQEGMYRWARWMTAVSAFGTLLTGIGLVFVWQSLRQTREAINNDREIGHAQVRAYVSLSNGKVARGADYVTFISRVVNNGSSPARRVQIQAFVRFYFEEIGIAYNGPPTFAFVGDQAQGSSVERTISLRFDANDPVISDFSYHLAVVAFVRYIDVFGNAYADPFVFQMLRFNQILVEGNEPIPIGARPDWMGGNDPNQ
jgi:hypothetical protein